MEHRLTCKTYNYKISRKHTGKKLCDNGLCKLCFPENLKYKSIYGLLYLLSTWTKFSEVELLLS